MNAQMQPLAWRMEASSQPGLAVVNLIVVEEGEEPVLLASDICLTATTVLQDLNWSDEDCDLFLALLERISDVDDDAEPGKQHDLELDIHDAVVQGIVQLVALRRFQPPLPSDELLADDVVTEREELEIGDLVAINTVHGYPLGIVVELDSIDATCVLLDDLDDTGGECLLHEHQLLVVNRLAALPAGFAPSDLGEGAIIH